MGLLEPQSPWPQLTTDWTLLATAFELEMSIAICENPMTDSTVADSWMKKSDHPVPLSHAFWPALTVACIFFPP